MLTALLLGVAVTLGSWMVFGPGFGVWKGYDSRLKEETRRALDASFLFFDVARLWPLSWLSGGVLALVGAWLGGHWWLAVPILGLAAWLPNRLLSAARTRRQRRFDAQLPDLVQALAGALRAGAAVQPALQHILSQSLPPLSQEFGLMLREQRLGLGFREALAKLALRMPTESCALVVSALGVAAQTGGGLADTLDGIADTLRTRQHWIGRVRALTAQGRMQSRIMAALPLLLLAVLVRLEPQAMSELWTTGLGWTVLLAILALEVVGAIWIRRIVAIEV